MEVEHPQATQADRDPLSIGFLFGKKKKEIWKVLVPCKPICN